LTVPSEAGDVSDNGSLDGEIAIVTGASAGIGRATARVLADAGADVALAARRRERLEALAADLRESHDVEAVAVPTNVRNESEVDALVETTVDRLGGLDILVNNAGVLRGDDVAETATEDYRLMMETNV
jgi:NADP-dependent 3-hydroxy acid dehydrogenase YdfG